MMQRGLVFLVLAALFLAYAHAALLPPFPAPAIFWSNQRIFASNQEQCLDHLNEVDIGTFVSSLSGSTVKSALSRYVDSSAPRPEAVVLFVEEESSSNREAYSFLQTLLDSAASSLVAPYTYPEAPVTDALFNNKASVQPAFLSALSSDKDVLAYFDGHRDILSNGKADVIVVQIASGDASLISEVDQRLAGSAFIMGYIADTSFQAAEKSVRMVSTDVITKRSYDGDYWPSDVWSGIVISVTLLILLAIGIGCLCELQIPTKWEKTKRTIKEIN